MSGLAQFVAARGLGTLREWCEEGYNAVSAIDEQLSGEITLKRILSDACRDTQYIQSKAHTYLRGFGNASVTSGRVRHARDT